MQLTTACILKSKKIPGVSAHPVCNRKSYDAIAEVIKVLIYIPGCIEEKAMLGYCSAHLLTITTCWRYTYYTNTIISLV